MATKTKKRPRQIRINGDSDVGKRVIEIAKEAGKTSIKPGDWRAINKATDDFFGFESPRNKGRTAAGYGTSPAVGAPRTVPLILRGSGMTLPLLHEIARNLEDQVRAQNDIITEHRRLRNKSEDEIVERGRTIAELRTTIDTLSEQVVRHKERAGQPSIGSALGTVDKVFG